MGYLEISLIGIGLAMDAFAVSVCKGIKMQKLKKSHLLVIVLFFSGFQMLMPLCGWLLGKQFVEYIEAFDHWISFGLLAFIGIKMVIEAFRGDEECCCDEKDTKLNIKELFLLAVATSIDALAAGLAFSTEKNLSIIVSIIIIGVITFVICAIGVLIGHLCIKFGGKLGEKFQFVAELLGGCVLVGIGVKLLIEGLLA